MRQREQDEDAYQKTTTTRRHDVHDVKYVVVPPSPKASARQAVVTVVLEISGSRWAPAAL
jgi:hypothetical protein